MNARIRHCRGQAMAEYTIVLLFVVVALIAAAEDPSAVEQLVEAIREAYAAFSYAISFSV